MKVYITFGQVHVHRVNNKTFDKDCVAVIDCKNMSEGRQKAFELFGEKWAFCYWWDDIKDSMHYFPRGLIEVQELKGDEK